MDNEPEIDLGKYFDVLVRRWRVIAALTVLLALIGLLYAFMRKPTYEATALAVVTRPRYVLEFDPKFQTITTNIQPAYKAYLDLAASDEIMALLYSGLSPLPAEVEGLQDVREMLEAHAGGDPSILRLSAQGADPETAQRLANAWVDVFTHRANQVFSTGGTQEVAFFEQNLEGAIKNMEAADAALVEFVGSTQYAVMGNRLASAKRAQAEYLARRVALANLIEDVRALRSLVEGQAAGTPLDFSHRATLLLMEIEGLNASGGNTIQLQLGEAAVVGTMRAADQVAFIDGLEDSLLTRLGQVGDRVEEVEAQIPALEQQMEELQNRKEQLERTRDVAAQVYKSLAAKLEEVRLLAEDGSAGTVIASHALAPEKPAGPRKALIGVVGAAAGLLAGVVTAYALELAGVPTRAGPGMQAHGWRRTVGWLLAESPGLPGLAGSRAASADEKRSTAGP